MTLTFMIINAIAGVLLLVMLSNHLLPMINVGMVVKVGLWIGAVGLISQSLRTGFMLFGGHFPFDDLPIWMLKDFGYWCVSAGLLFHLIDRHET